MALHPTRPESLAVPLREPHVLQSGKLARLTARLLKIVIAARQGIVQFIPYRNSVGNAVYGIDCPLV
jgi:hypothetical protein